MATYYPPPTISATRPPQYATTVTAVPAIPAGTFVPGTKVQVGDHRVVIERYLSEGGFAHVYVVRVPTANGATETAVLKRVAVPDKEALTSMRTEVETMKKLKGHGHIVTYIDSHASQLKGGGYEVFLLMEFCEGGGLIDFMNTRLKNRLTEPEILKIFSDAAEGVACMHYLKPPLLHRDIKIENILISSSGSTKYYKLCDFGSAAVPRPAATSAAEGRLIEEDVQKHTTLQYRSPEMIDVYRKRPIDEKSDIWALGVFLYKLCYYTTPFEEQGQMAILTAKFKFPGYPSFSDSLKKLIATMLSEDPKHRPNIYQVLKEVCSMRGKEVPIKDIYTKRTASQARSNQKPPVSSPDIISPPIVGAVQSTPEQVKQALPDITPMRRGRPTISSRPLSVAASNAPPAHNTSTDPFAALDSRSSNVRAAAVEEMASRFPAVEDFSLLQNNSTKFQFETSPISNTPVDKRMVNALADEVFAQTASKPHDTVSRSNLSPIIPKKVATTPIKGSRIASSSAVESTVPKDDGVATKSTMVSIGTMTSRPTSPEVYKPPRVSDRPVWRIPLNSSARQFPEVESRSRDNRTPSSRLKNEPRQNFTSAQSSRPSLEGLRSAYLGAPGSLHRSKSMENRARSSDQQVASKDDGHAQNEATNLQGTTDEGSTTPLKQQSTDDESNIESSIDYLRVVEEDGRSKRNRRGSHNRIDLEFAVDESTIDSSVDYLKAMEEKRESKGLHSRKSSMQRSKHASMPTMALSNTKNSLAGRFGEVLRRFETVGAGTDRDRSPEALTMRDTGRLSPVPSVERPTVTSYEGDAIGETEELSAEMRREIERRQVALEERRVADAAAAYRQRLEGAPTGSYGGGIASRKASGIQERVKNLLDESGRASPVKKTAKGYGKYTGTTTESAAPPSIPTQPILFPSASSKEANGISPGIPASAPTTIHIPSGARPGELNPPKLRNPTKKPSAPPKPPGLRIGAGPGVSAQDSRSVSLVAPVVNGDIVDDELEDFSKRYPSLSLELVETEIAASEPSPQRLPNRTGRTRIRDV